LIAVAAAPIFALTEAFKWLRRRARMAQC